MLHSLQIQIISYLCTLVHRLSTCISCKRKVEMGFCANEGVPLFYKYNVLTVTQRVLSSICCLIPTFSVAMSWSLALLSSGCKRNKMTQNLMHTRYNNSRTSRSHEGIRLNAITVIHLHSQHTNKALGI